MIITDIKESGSNNILRWAISNNADIKEDFHLQSIINNELSYILHLEDVNFFELFRLSQIYRERIRITDEKQSDLPLRKDIIKLFPGDYKTDEGTVPLYELVEHSCQLFINLALQMKSDDDIIRPDSIRLFIPMLCRKFSVQIPIQFSDLVTSLKPEESKRLFNKEYPNNLYTEIVENNSYAKMMLELSVFKMMQIVKYNDHYEKIINTTKFNILKKADSKYLWKVKLSAFHKYDAISKRDVVCTLFNADKTDTVNKMKSLSRINNPLKADFAVQIPIQYMQMILNHFSFDDLQISYESSMGNIITNGMKFNDFISSEWIDKSDEKAIQEYNNSIEAYTKRIEECNQTVLNTITILINNPSDVDVNSSFALLPSLYYTNAIFTIDISKAEKYLNHYDPMIAEMFQEMLDQLISVQEDINKSK